MIVANLFLFMIQDSLTPRSWYVLEFGNGLHPVQWVLSAFAHAHPGHLIGNMIFLFSFGIVVESMMKLQHFFMVYFAIAIIESVVTQTMMLGGSGGALGASGAIFGMMMVGCICAPDKNIKWLFCHFFFRQIASFEVPVLLVGLFYFLWDFGAAMFDSFSMSTPLLHSTGAIAGLAVGFGAYRLNWFELDGEDLVSRLRVLFGAPAEDTKQKTEPTPQKARRLKFGKLKNQLHLFDQYAQKRNYPLMLMKLKQISYDHPNHELDKKQLVSLIRQGTNQKDWSHVVSWMDEYLTRFESNATAIRLNKARIQTVALHSPRAAQTTLQAIEPSKLSVKQKQVYYQLLKLIRQQIVSGVMEVEQPIARASKAKRVTTAQCRGEAG